MNQSIKRIRIVYYSTCFIDQKGQEEKWTKFKPGYEKPFTGWAVKTCKAWLGFSNIPQPFHTCTSLPPYSLCLVTVTKLFCPGQGFVSHTNQDKDPITAPAPALLPSLSLHLLSSSNPRPWSSLMRWWVYFLYFASVQPVSHRLWEGLGGSPVAPYIPLPWQQSWTKGTKQYNTGVLGFTDFMDWY